MNLMGKIFTFLIFLMSTVFLVVSIMVGASDRNWKALATTMKNRANSATSSVDLLKNETATLEKTLAFHKASRAQQLGNLQSQNRLAQEQLTQKATQFNEEQKISQGYARELEEANRRYARELEEANRRLKDQDAELANIKANNKKLVDSIAAEFAENRNRSRGYRRWH